MARAQRRVERVSFGALETAPIVARMAALAKVGDGWINLVPMIGEVDDRPTSLRFFTLFGGGGNGISMSTWIPTDAAQGGHRPTTVGINHLVGARVARELDRLDVPIPKGWTVTQDHPRRGLVVQVADEASHDVVLAWALRAVSVLSPPRAIATWRADVYLPAGL